MTSVKRDYNELTQIIDEDIKRVKEMKNLIHEAVKSSQQKAQTLKDYEANEEKELLGLEGYIGMCILLNSL